MADPTTPDPRPPLPSAESLRMAMLEKQLAEFEKVEKARDIEK